MQTKKMFSLILALVVTGTTFAQKNYYNTTINNNSVTVTANSFQVNLTSSKAGFNLWIQNPEKKKLQLTIQHRNSGTVIDTIIYNEEFNQRYNMEQADDGNYVITVSCGKERIVKEIELNTITTRAVKLN